MSNPGPKIILGAGAVTFTGEWYWQHSIDWKVPLATLLLAGGVSLLSEVDKNGATILAIMVAAGALSTKFSGHSAFEMITALVSNTGKTAGSKANTTRTVVQ